MDKQIDKQAVLDVLNSLEIIEFQGGEESYALVENNPENRARLNAVGISDETIKLYGEEDTFCVLALAFGERYADEVRNWKFIKWGPIDDEFRYRILSGEGTPADAERLLRLLEPNLFEEASNT